MNYWDLYNKYYINWNDSYIFSSNAIGLLMPYFETTNFFIEFISKSLSYGYILVNFLIFFDENLTIDSNIWLAETALKGLSDAINLEKSFSIVEPKLDTFVQEFMTNYYTLYLFLFTIIGVCYLYTSGLTVRSNTGYSVFTGLSAFTYFADIEEEFGQFDDLVSYIIFFFYFIFWFFLFNFFARFIILNYIITLLVIFLVILTTSFYTPIWVLYRSGLNTGLFIRGVAKGSNIFIATALDFVSIFVMVMRFFVQNIRFVFIFIGVFEYYEFIEEQIYPALNQPYNFYLISPNSVIVSLIFFISKSVLYLYYASHLTIVYISQLAIYFMLSFWIFFFLYTVFMRRTNESYFFFTRVEVVVLFILYIYCT